MEVRIDDNAGYCFGVVKAIGAAEEELSRSSSLYCLGDIVHNSAEVERLKGKGLCVINHDELLHLTHCKVLIRAHGEPPSTYHAAEQRGIELVDATCPIVLALQGRIRRGYEEMRSRNGQVVIFGKPGHAEVVGLTGQCDGAAIIVSREDELDAIDFSRPLRLYSQTTKSREEYQRLIANIKARLPEGADFVAYDTICNRVANRAKQLEAFAGSVDVLLFVAGANSSNGQYLYEYCRKVQPRTHLIGGPDEVDPAWVQGVSSVGISGATSTPRWLMEAVARELTDKN
ncbi:MAG: 4-hydroxy-3-methylbut-2-enyl diphosphate reductase [Bacteroidales bacterium]|nr:4-hydroxy-3-methylbut-2-enyl diphosphate reductase [Bacteroidales bacterium]